MLLVDSHHGNLLALEAILSSLGQTLVRASSGEQALKTLDDEFALVLLATQLSGIDGYETAAHIKRREQTRDIPILFVSAHGKGPHASFRGYAAGAVDHMTRPFDPWVLRAKVAVYVDLYQKNLRLREQAALLRSGAATDLLTHLSALLSDIETETGELTGRLRSRTASETVRTTVGRLERAVRSLRQVMRGAQESREGPGAPPTPPPPRSPRQGGR
ncbi:response regulator [Streptomyces sp. NPDC048002]|uniref:response regulator n=1 Tax=Streptomyces sp. NPDC048002 TaxID=3154344 RepID=UPI00340997D0